MILEQLSAAELDIHAGVEPERVTDSLGLAGHRALRHTEQLAQAVSSEVRDLARVEQEVVGPHSVDRAGRPDGQSATLERRRALARELGNELAAELGVLVVEMLAVEPIGDREDLADFASQRCRYS